MAKNAKNQKQAVQTTTETKVKAAPRYTASQGVVMLGSVLLLAALVASGMMVLNHFVGLELPGCGKGSACDQAAASRWGKVPGIGLPTSFVGLAYFAGLLLAWVGSFGALTSAGRWVVRLGALVSVGLLFVVFNEDLKCSYCIATHACNLVFWLLMEAATRGLRSGGGPLAVGGVVTLASLGALGYFDAQAQSAAKLKAEQQLAEDTKKMVQPAGSGNAAPATPSQPSGPSVPQATEPKAPVVEAPAPVAPAKPAGFSGLYQWGPEKAAVRIVMYTDYQCPDCQRIEGDLRNLLSNPNVAVLIKHFPLSNQCNPQAPGNLHPNACWAARAAQTAGILRGKDGFWAMHHWLFDRKGSFTDADFPPALTGMGYDAQEFLRVMQSQEPLTRVRAHIDEGIALGLHFTPLVFVNGVELKGWNAPQALTRAVNAVLASNPEPKTFADDAKPTALDKYMNDWRSQPVRNVPAAVTQRFIGPADAPVTIVLFGDYMEPGTQEADGLLRLFATGADAKFKYSFAHFPVDAGCNPATTMVKFPGSCRNSIAAEAADMVDGPETFWKMHAFIMGSKGVTTDASLENQAAMLGIDVAAFKPALTHPEPAARIKRDALAAQGIGIQSIPFIVINGKYVPRFKLDNENLLPRMIEEAYLEATAKR